MTDKIILECADRDDEPLHSNEEFLECDTCRVKLGIPDLCRVCLHNRSLIETLKSRIKAITPRPAPKCPKCDKWMYYAMTSPLGAFMECGTCGYEELIQ